MVSRQSYLILIFSKIMDCSYCKKDMADSDICPSCGMGKRVDFELFKASKKDFEILNLDEEKRKKDV